LKESFNVRPTRFAAFLAVLGLGVAAYTPIASASSPRYGPAGDKFTVAFPSAPKSAANTSQLLSGLPTGVRAYAYWVSASANIISGSSKVPKPPTYLIALLIFPSLSATQSYLKGATASASGLSPVTLDGLKGYEYVGPENGKVNPPADVTDRKATEALVALQRKDAVYLLSVITSTRKETETFLGSFRAV
jgi:hypothetical protein